DQEQAEGVEDPLAEIGDAPDVLHGLDHAPAPSMASALPPAASIFLAAEAVNRCARTVRATFSSPFPRILMGSAPLRRTPDCSRASGVSTLPASKAFSRSTLTVRYSFRNRLWNPRLGMRRWSGIWPPSKPRLLL